MRRRSDYPAWILLTTVLAVVRLMPRSLALFMGATLGGLLRALGLRRAVTDANLAVAFPDLLPAERAGIARGVYAHFGRMSVDALRLSVASREALLALMDGGDDVVALLERERKKGKGVLVLTGHIGNWELAGSYLAARGLPLSAVVKPPSNPYVAKDAEAARRRLGMETITMDTARSGVMKALEHNRVVALVADQGELRSAIRAPFFGVPTRTATGPGLFAALSGAPVTFGVLVALSGGRYHISCELMDAGRIGDPREASQRLANDYRARLEAAVRRWPDQYLWTHRLWRKDLQDEPAASAAAPPGVP